MRRLSTGFAVLAAAAAVVTLPACSGGGPAGPSVTGAVTSLVPAFCVATGTSPTCFVTAHADGVKQGDLKVGDCVVVGYRDGEGDATARTATSIERSRSC